MPGEMYKRLAETVERDGRLESLPFLAETDRGVEIVSGHHRTRAARTAGLTHTFGLLDVTGLTRDQIRAKQLAHNSISGFDDPQIKKRIYEQIDDVTARLEAFVDPRVLELDVKRYVIPTLDVGIKHKLVNIVFLPAQWERFDEIAAAAARECAGDEIGVVDLELLERFRAATASVTKHHNIRSMGTVVAIMAETVAERLGVPPAETDPDEWVAIVDLVGRAHVPPHAAETIRLALERAQSKGHATEKEPWAALEHWASEYLAGA